MTHKSRNQSALIFYAVAAMAATFGGVKYHEQQQAADRARAEMERTLVENERIRKERDEQLRRAELIIESEDRAILMCSEDGTITVSNVAAEQMTGWSGKELIGKPSTMIIPERFRQDHTERVAAAAERIRNHGGNSLLTRKEMEIEILRRNGEELPALADIRVIKYGSLVESIISMRRVHTQRAPMNQIQRLPPVTVPPPEVEGARN